MIGKFLCLEGESVILDHHHRKFELNYVTREIRDKDGKVTGNTRGLECRIIINGHEGPPDDPKERKYQPTDLMPGDQVEVSGRPVTLITVVRRK